MIYLAALQIDEDSTFVLFGAILKTLLATNLFHSWLNLLYVISAMISLANNDVEVGFSPLPCSSNAFFEHVFSLFNEQTMQVDSVAGDAALSIVLAEDVVAGLTVVLLHLCSMSLALFRELVGACTIAGLVSLMCSVEARAALCCLFAGKVAQAIVLDFSVRGRMIECYIFPLDAKVKKDSYRVSEPLARH